MSTYTWSVRFDDGSSVVEYDDAGGKLAPVNRANSENIIALERLHAAE